MEHDENKIQNAYNDDWTQCFLNLKSKTIISYFLTGPYTLMVESCFEKPITLWTYFIQ